jgi:anti-sigma factor RsiW
MMDNVGQTGGLNHSEALALFSAHLDTELDTAARVRLEVHFARCEPCRTEYQTFARTILAARRIRRRSAPVGFTQAVMARVRREKKLVRSDRTGIVLFRRFQIPHQALTALLLMGCAAELVALVSVINTIYL